MPATLQGTIGVFETLGSEFATGLIALSSASTGYVFSALGACGAITLVCFSRLVQRYDEVRLTISGIYLMIFSCVLMSCIPVTVTFDAEGKAEYSSGITVVFVIAVCSMYATGSDCIYYPAALPADLTHYRRIPHDSIFLTLLLIIHTSFCLPRVTSLPPSL